MKYPVSVFEKLESSHQIRLLYKLLREKNELFEEAHLYGDFIKDPHLKAKWQGLLEKEGVDEVLVVLENILNTSVRDHEFIEELIEVRKGDQERETGEGISKFSFVLHDIRSAFNVGALFRTSECLGMSQLFLTGYTPSPEQSVVQKTAMGTHEFLSWKNEKIENLLKQKDLPKIAIETVEGVDNIHDFSFSESGLIFLGNERKGLPQEVLKEMDVILQIPVCGRKNSLNVAVAGAVIGYEVLRQKSKSRN